MLFWCDLKFEKGEKKLAKRRIRTRVDQFFSGGGPTHIYFASDAHDI